MMKPQSLFRWGVALQQRSRLRPSNRKEKVKLFNQAKRLLEYALCMDSNNVQNILWNDDVKERMLRQIEPRIRRELQAILEDSDPSVIVHLATSLYTLSLEEKVKSQSEHLVVEDKFFEQLRPFLHDWTDIFCHELSYMVSWHEKEYCMGTHLRSSLNDSLRPLGDLSSFPSG